MTKKKAEERIVDLAVAYKNIFSSPQGEMVLYDLMNRGHILQSSFGKNLSPHDIFFREGERNVVLQILSMLDLDVQRLKEHIKRKHIKESEYGN